jgi:hypothetical protein
MYNILSATRFRSLAEIQTTQAVSIVRGAFGLNVFRDLFFSSLVGGRVEGSCLPSTQQPTPICMN